MLAALEQFGRGGEILPRLQHLHVAEDEVSVHELVERGLLSGILAVAEPLLLATDVPGHLLVAQRLAPVTGNERNLHLRREVVGLDGPVGGFQILHEIPFTVSWEKTASF